MRLAEGRCYSRQGRCYSRQGSRGTGGRRQAGNRGCQQGADLGGGLGGEGVQQGRAQARHQGGAAAQPCTEQAESWLTKIERFSSLLEISRGVRSSNKDGKILSMPRGD